MIDQYPPSNGVLTSLIWRKTAAGGETSLSGYDNASQALSYTPGQEQVYLNGILLVRGSDYTATNGTSITGLAALAADDFVQVNCYNNFSVASLPSTSITGEITNSQITSLATSKLTGTIANNQLANSSITINGSPVSLGGSTTVAATNHNHDSTYIANTLTTTTGDIIYASAANTPARLGIGSSGQVLSVSGGVPVWAAAGTTNDYILLNSGGTALTGASTITVNFTAHNKLALRYEASTTNTSSYIQLRFNSDSGANYFFSGLKLTGTTAGRDGSFGGNEFNMGRMGNSAINVVYTIAMVEGAKGTGYKPFYAYGNADGTTTNESFSYGGLYAGSSPITSVSLISSSGNFDAGTLYIYGAN